MNYLLEALSKKLEGDIAIAHANIKAYERNVVGIGEHPEIVQAIELELEKLATAQDKLDTLKKYFK
tara:strand:+ start:165 stop:362 length:198 start_codon:yes stop_codon:yes gene_type:complete